MSTWVEGGRYRYYDVGDLVCMRRYFEDSLEMVDLAFAVEAPRAPEVFTRTARALAPCVVPRVTETLGGVRRADACDHRGYPRVLANAGPHAGHQCCEACGGAT